jgi:putative transposase
MSSCPGYRERQCCRMARPLRIEFSGAIYHVTSRGDRREPIFVDEDDRRALLGVVAQALHRFDATMLVYCLMGNHYHFVLQTRHGNLSSLMRYINGVYSQTFNRRHNKVGHLFQGRFKAILVDRDAYLLEVCRYVEMNPVRARLVVDPFEWRWSSLRAHLGLQPSPRWLDTSELYAMLLGHTASDGDDRRQARQRYAELVADARDLRLWDDSLRQQIFLGDEAFVERMLAIADPKRRTSPEVPTIQRATPWTLAQWLAACPSREEALLRAHVDSLLTVTAIARELNLSVSRVSRLIKRQKDRLDHSEATGKT